MPPGTAARASTLSSSFGRLAQRSRVEVILQNHGGGGRVQLRLALAPVLFADGQALLRFPARQALVTCEYRNGETRREQRHHGTDATGLPMSRPIEPGRQPHDDSVDFVLDGELSNQSVEPFDRVCIRRTALDCSERTRKCSRRVAHRHADSPLAEIQTYDTHSTRVTSRGA